MYKVFSNGTLVVCDHHSKVIARVNNMLVYETSIRFKIRNLIWNSNGTEGTEGTPNPKYVFEFKVGVKVVRISPDTKEITVNYVSVFDSSDEPKLNIKLGDNIEELNIYPKAKAFAVTEGAGGSENDKSIVTTITEKVTGLSKEFGSIVTKEILGMIEALLNGPK